MNTVYSDIVFILMGESWHVHYHVCESLPPCGGEFICRSLPLNGKKVTCMWESPSLWERVDMYVGVSIHIGESWQVKCMWDSLFLLGESWQVRWIKPKDPIFCTGGPYRNCCHSQHYTFICLFLLLHVVDLSLFLVPTRIARSKLCWPCGCGICCYIVTVLTVYPVHAHTLLPCVGYTCPSDILGTGHDCLILPLTILFLQQTLLSSFLCYQSYSCPALCLLPEIILKTFFSPHNNIAWWVYK